MKKVTAVIIVLLMTALFFTGCGKAAEKPVGGESLKIYTSFYPMYFLASRIAGDRAEVTSMVPAGAEPHDWEPTPRLAAELKNADMLVYNGAGMETWIDNILSIVDRDRTRIVDASKGIELLEAEDESHEHGSCDPHIWVSPMRLKQQAQTVYEAIRETDPGNSVYYEKNMTELVSELTKLDEDIRDAVKSFRSNVIVVSHEAFGYFAEDYGLKQVAIRGVNPQDEPTSSEFIRLVEECRKNNVRYIFFEKLTSPKLSEALAKEVGAGTLVLNDAAGLNEEDIKSGRDYITVMYENLENLKKALGD